MRTTTQFVDEVTLRNRIVTVCARMHSRGLISGGEGNVSVRLGADRLLVTPSGVNKGFLESGELVVTDLDGVPQKKSARASTEIQLHVKAYRARPDIGAVIHAHPPTAVAFTLAGLSLGEHTTPESVMTLGDVPTAAYATPSTSVLAEGAADLLVHTDVVMMERHGSVCVGVDVFSAYDRLESLEHTAKTMAMARLLGPVQPLEPNEIMRLRALAMGASVPVEKMRRSENDELVERVVAAILKQL